jgi:rare lipoprotein A
MRLKNITICVLLAFVTACSSNNTAITGIPPTTGAYPGHYKVGTPYKIADQWYYPKRESNYVEEGVASWYGPGFHGRRTANGDLYDQKAFTAAHRTLPLPSMVQITNMANGKSVTAMVNDRGPFSKRRIIDVSERVAEAIGIKRQGTGQVRVQFLPAQTKELLRKLALSDGEVEKITATDEKRTVAALNASALKKINQEKAFKSRASETYAQGAAQFMKKEKQVFVQAGAYTRQERAKQVAANLSKIAPTSIVSIAVDSGTLYRVRLGPLKDNVNANRVLEKVINAGNSNAIIVGNNG